MSSTSSIFFCKPKFIFGEKYTISNQKCENAKAKTETSKESLSSSRVNHCAMPRRYIVVSFGFLCYIILNCQRLNLTMALVTMTENPNRSDERNKSISECPMAPENTSMIIPIKHKETFYWNTALQSYIISASYLGFVLTQTPGGRLSETIGAKQILVSSLIVASLCNLISPLAASWSPYALLAFQLIKGMFLGMINPAVFYLTTNWFPKVEKCFLTSFVFTGFPVGAFVGGIICGYLCDVQLFGGWPLVFYLFGILGLMLSVSGQVLIPNHPEEDTKISEAELKYILMNQEATSVKQLKVPWKEMLLSKATWALVVGLFGQYWFFYYFLSIHPVYLEGALHFYITQSGIVASVPYLTQIIVTWCSSYFSDWLTKNEYTSVNTVRKTCNTLGSLGLALSIIGVVFAGCDKTLNSALFFIAMTCFGFAYPGCLTVPSDMSPEFSGTLMGVTSTIASTSSFILPLIVGSIVTNDSSIGQWHKVLYISAGVGLGSGLIFNVFGSAELQKWNKDECQRKNEASHQPQNSSQMQPQIVIQTSAFDKPEMIKKL